MTKQDFNDALLGFLDASPTPFHAVINMSGMLLNAGFIELDEKQDFNLVVGQSYFIVRADSSIIAFNYYDGFEYLLVGAHTDSPNLKIKPNAEIKKDGITQLGVEPYGGVLLNPWFDRDLSIAGRVSYKSIDARLKSTIIDMQKAVAIIPSLAIHLDRDVNISKTVNEQNHLPPIVSTSKDFSLKSELASMIDDCQEVLSYDLSLYDTQKASYVGFGDEFIASARLDNLLSCYISLITICSTQKPMMMVCSDHEEVGSVSVAGAGGSFLESVIERMFPTPETKARFARSSLLISADNAHAVHPNYVDKHEPLHAPKLNHGVVVKVNSNQRYASSSETIASFLDAAASVGETTQMYVTRSDMGCGSTIGPITAAKIGIDTIDIGVPTFAMHSIRESAGSDDAYSLYKILLEI
ncbi:MAG: M18 family aminopeptidase [Thiovulaceae bacterium]|nr:M18 family aminopeptidase [Sulfurimonadaceae bacterium]